MGIGRAQFESFHRARAIGALQGHQEVHGGHGFGSRGPWAAHKKSVQPANFIDGLFSFSSVSATSSSSRIGEAGRVRSRVARRRLAAREARGPASSSKPSAARFRGARAHPKQPQRRRPAVVSRRVAGAAKNDQSAFASSTRGELLITETVSSAGRSMGRRAVPLPRLLRRTAVPAKTLIGAARPRGRPPQARRPSRRVATGPIHK